jgi:hypothetical protein
MSILLPNFLSNVKSSLLHRRPAYNKYEGFSALQAVFLSYFKIILTSAQELVKHFERFEKNGHFTSKILRGAFCCGS